MVGVCRRGVFGVCFECVSGCLTRVCVCVCVCVVPGGSRPPSPELTGPHRTRLPPSWMPARLGRPPKRAPLRPGGSFPPLPSRGLALRRWGGFPPRWRLWLGHGLDLCPTRLGIARLALSSGNSLAPAAGRRLGGPGGRGEPGHLRPASWVRGLSGDPAPPSSSPSAGLRGAPHVEAGRLEGGGVSQWAIIVWCTVRSVAPNDFDPLGRVPGASLFPGCPFFPRRLGSPVMVARKATMARPPL